jgi:DNA repair protein RadB
MGDNRISAGSFDLNKWLHGGYEKEIITMIAGPPGCGKTNFCILASCSQAKKGNRVIFVDTEAGFSVERVKQIVGEEHERILGNILLLEPTSFEEQKKCFLKLLNKIKKEHVTLIVVDGMAMFYRLELGDAVKLNDDWKIRQVNREIAKQMRILSEIARKQGIPIIITNQVYGSFVPKEDWGKNIPREMNIVGGDLFKYWSKCIIELKMEGSKRKAVLLKHRSLPQKEMGFVIKNEGVFKRGWI